MTTGKTIALTKVRIQIRKYDFQTTAPYQLLIPDHSYYSARAWEDYVEQGL